MNKLQGTVPINRTKLYRPPVTIDFISRDTLERRLETNISLPLTVVSAPAGYGKSTLISHWLENSDSYSAWLSLDESDSDLRIFLTYFVAAVRTISAESCLKTLINLNAENIPSLKVIATHLINDIDALGERLILALDDYHHIQNSQIHLLIEHLLDHPSPYLHLVILSRYDPNLSLASLRALHLLNEISMRDLKFTNDDTHVFVKRISGHSFKETTIERLQNSTEGWPAGIRLASLALQSQDNVEEFLNHFETTTQPVREYLFEEVLSGLSPQILDCLLSISVLERFNTSLCEAVWDKNNQDIGKDFIQTLEKSGFFCIGLDSSHNWFRFHHIFGALLKQQLEDIRSKEEISLLHKKASSWFVDRGYYEEAIHHALAYDNETAAKIVGEARHELMNQDQWHRLERWLNIFSRETIHQHIHLLLLRCWLDLYHWYRLDYLVKDLDSADVLLETLSIKVPESASLNAEVAAIRSNLSYWVLKPSHGVTLAQQALHDSPDGYECVQSTALLGWGALCQMTGELQQGEHVLWNHMEDGRFNSPSSKARLIQSLCLSYWPEANTWKLQQSASRLLAISLENNQPWNLSFAHYFLGLIHYEHNELNNAVAQLEIVTSHPYRFPIQNVVHCSFLLSLSYQAMGCSERASEIADSIAQFTFERGNRMFIDLVAAFQADLDLRQGRIAKANQWAQDFKIPAPHAMQRFFNAELTYIKVMMAQDISQNREVIVEQLNSLHDLLSQTHHRRLLIDVLGMKALLADRDGDVDTAIALLNDALVIGQPGQLIRPLADFGSGLIKLFNYLDLNQEGLQYVAKIIAALEKSSEISTIHDMPETLPVELSQRELQILELIAIKLRNKEIAERLFISTGTVKRHAHNIYRKLAISGRRDAVTKARELGILSTNNTSFKP